MLAVPDPLTVIAAPVVASVSVFTPPLYVQTADVPLGSAVTFPLMLPQVRFAVTPAERSAVVPLLIVRLSPEVVMSAVPEAKLAVRLGPPKVILDDDVDAAHETLAAPLRVIMLRGPPEVEHSYRLSVPVLEAVPKFCISIVLPVPPYVAAPWALNMILFVEYVPDVTVATPPVTENPNGVP